MSRETLKTWALALALAVVILAPTAQAAEGPELVIHGLSHHFHQRQHHADPSLTWRENNPGAGLRWEFSPVRAVEAGAYRNSLDRNSLYVLTDWTPASLGPVRVGASIGLRTGYSNVYPVLPAAGFVARWELSDRVALTVRAAPKVANKSSALIAASVGVRFK